MNFPELSRELLLERLTPPTGKVQMVLDTDTYNEIDDQFAVVYSLLSPEQMDLQAIYAAPFHNDRSDGPGDGMEKSYEEILRLLDKLNVPSDGFVFRGSTSYLESPEKSCESEAVDDLIERAMAADDVLYVAPIGAITNIASAILKEPEIIRKIVVVWLGGHAHYWGDTREFNLKQDVPAARIIFDCGVPVVQFPCMGVVSQLHSTIPEIEAHVRGRGAIGDYLADIFKEYCHGDPKGWSKVIWDIAAVAYLINSDWTPSEIVPSPMITDDVKWAFDDSRHPIRYVKWISRDCILRDLFNKLPQA